MGAAPKSSRVEKPRDAVVALATPDISDEELVFRARGGDRWAEETLFRRYAPLVIATTMRITQNLSDAEDAAQETFARALEKLGSLRDASAFRGWLLRIAFSRAHRVFRRRRWLRLVGLAPELPEVTLGRSPPETDLELALVEDVLREIEPNRRQAWLLRRVEELSLDEVSEAVRRSPATVKRWVSSVDARLERHAEGRQ